MLDDHDEPEVAAADSITLRVLIEENFQALLVVRNQIQQRAISDIGLGQSRLPQSFDLMAKLEAEEERLRKAGQILVAQLSRLGQ